MKRGTTDCGLRTADLAKRLFKSVVRSPWSVVLLSLPLWAASLDAKVANIEAAYQHTPALQAEFIQKTYVSLLEKTITRPGRLFYQKGGKIRIEYGGTPMTHYVSDGQTLWVRHPKEKREEGYALKDSGLPEEALNFLTELGDLRKYFKVSQKEEGKLTLKPKRKSTYKELTCLFDQDHYLKDLTIHTLSGNTSRYHFFNLEKKASLPPELFN